MGCTSSKNAAQATKPPQTHQTQAVSEPEAVKEAAQVAVERETTAQDAGDHLQLPDEPAPTGENAATSEQEVDVAKVDILNAADPQELQRQEQQKEQDSSDHAMVQDQETPVAATPSTTESSGELTEVGEETLGNVDEESEPNVVREDSEATLKTDVESHAGLDEDENKSGSSTPNDDLSEDKKEILAQMAEEVKKEQDSDVRPEMLSVKDKAKMFASGSLYKHDKAAHSLSSGLGSESSVRDMAKKYSSAGAKMSSSNQLSSSNSARLEEISEATRNRKSSQTMKKYWTTKEEIERIVQTKKEF